MSSPQVVLSSDRLEGRMSLVATVVSLYVLITLSLVQVLGVPYILLSGSSDASLVSSDILIVAGVRCHDTIFFTHLEMTNEEGLSSRYSR